MPAISRCIDDRLSVAFEPVRDALSEVASTVRRCAGRFSWLIDSLVEATKALPGQARPTLAKLAERGWYVSDQAPVPMLYDLDAYFSAPDLAQVDACMSAFVTSELNESPAAECR